MLDLTPFCSTDPSRPYLGMPFNRGDLTYATNGHIAVRVPKRRDCPEGKTAAEKVFPADPPISLRELPKYKIPRVKSEACGACDGRGYEHDCPDCTCVCIRCDGAGKCAEPISVALGGAVFDGRYIKMLLRLKSVMVPADPDPFAGMYFKFDGGEGVLMPMRRARAKHVREPDGQR